MTLLNSLIRLMVLCTVASRLPAMFQDARQDIPAAVEPGGESAEPDSSSSGEPPSALSPAILPVLPSASKSPETARKEESVNWTGLFRASGRFLAIEHSFRLLTEPGTREGLKGSFIHNYARAVGGLHGFADGDEFYVNYVGHPMQGSVAGFLWAGNDRRYRNVEFGRTPEYWKSRLRAAGFMWVYSTQFEIGTFSEASIGAIQATPPQQGFVDHVITPSLGLGWMVAEDALDKYAVQRVEAAISNKWIRMFVRGGLNPSRTFANVLRGKAPWHRDNRAGVSTYRPVSPITLGVPAMAARREASDDAGPPPFELNMGFHAERMLAGGKSLSCAGGGATAAFRIAREWQFAVDVGGCNLFGLDRNLSGDSLVYMAGPRWVSGGTSPWSAHWQFLIGGNKLTGERMYPERKRLLDELSVRNGTLPPTHDQYTDSVETNGLALATAAGIDYKISRALAIRVAELSYRHSWVGPLWGTTYSDTVKIVTGLVLRMGTW
jgi:hypothetical protein